MERGLTRKVKGITLSFIVLGSLGAIFGIVTLVTNQDNQNCPTCPDCLDCPVCPENEEQIPDGYIVASFPANAKFVSTLGVDAPDRGNKTHPCLTINYTITLANTTGSSAVVVGAGVYKEEVVVLDGISVLGGYSPDFKYYSLQNARAEILAPNQVVRRKTFLVENVTTATVLEGLVIYGPVLGTTNSLSSYTIYVKDCNGSLIIRNCSIYGGRGANSAQGTFGTNGAAGGNGETGWNAMLWGISYQKTMGGAGGTSAAGMPGGRGGNSTYPDYTTYPSESWEEYGTDGAGAMSPYGIGGDPGADGLVDGTGTQIYYSSMGQNGVNGMQGTDASGGSGASINGGTVVSGEWYAVTGNNGGAGTHGGGGGGGGAGGGVENDSMGITPSLGGAGGGGGGGGQRGTGGLGGAGGGGAICVFLYFTSAPASTPQIYNNSLYTGIGGTGGAGGNGGTGGDGGRGGNGGINLLSSANGPTWRASVGGYGGNGARGGHGGAGGGGAGGSSYGFFVSGTTGPASYKSLNTITTTTGSGGTGGVGGSSLYSPGGLGGNGVIGTNTNANF